MYTICKKTYDYKGRIKPNAAEIAAFIKESYPNIQFDEDKDDEEDGKHEVIDDLSTPRESTEDIGYMIYHEFERYIRCDEKFVL